VGTPDAFAGASSENGTRSQGGDYQAEIKFADGVLQLRHSAFIDLPQCIIYRGIMGN
jgi:hypothetical protein